MVAIVGDAELDEGNIYEALLEGWKHDVRNLWWVIDYNRQSLDRVVPELLFAKIEQFFATVGWRVVTIKYGKKLQAAFARARRRGPARLDRRLPERPLRRLVLQGRCRLARASGERSRPQPGHPRRPRRPRRRRSSAALMTNLGGHDLEAVLEAFHGVADDRPHCFIAYTVKGWGLPLAGHKDNHSGLMTPDQMAALQSAHGVPTGEEWSTDAGLDVPPERLRRVPGRRAVPRAGSSATTRRRCRCPATLPQGRRAATGLDPGGVRPDHGRARAQRPAAGRADRHHLARRHGLDQPRRLGRPARGVQPQRPRGRVPRRAGASRRRPGARAATGQHLELGIAENNLFLNLASLGLAHELFGARLLPVGTLYDPFIARGLDALNYACYQDARFLLVATPSGITLAPEGGAHQSIGTPLIGISQPGLTSFEPAFADEVAVMLRWAFEHLQAPDGGSVYLRLSTRQIAPARARDDAGADRRGPGRWLLAACRPQPGAELAIVCTGAVAPGGAQGAGGWCARTYPAPACCT